MTDKTKIQDKTDIDRKTAHQTDTMTQTGQSNKHSNIVRKTSHEEKLDKHRQTNQTNQHITDQRMTD